MCVCMIVNANGSILSLLCVAFYIRSDIIPTLLRFPATSALTSTYGTRVRRSARLMYLVTIAAVLTSKTIRTQKTNSFIHPIHSRSHAATSPVDNYFHRHSMQQDHVAHRTQPIQCTCLTHVHFAQAYFRLRLPAHPGFTPASDQSPR